MAANRALRAVAVLCLALGAAAPGPAGIFTDQSDVGSVVPPGTGAYDSATGIYTVTSAGANLWYREDDFHFLWKKVSGDLAIQADVTWPPATYGHDPNEHRKALLMMRQSLDPDGVYVDVAPHGNGLVALQYRRAKGANSQDIEVNLGAPKTVRLEKRGDRFTMLVSFHGEPLHRIGATITLHLDGEFYAGLGLTSHDVTTTDVVRFSNVLFETPAPWPAVRGETWSTLQVIQTEDQYRRSMMIHTARGVFEGANVAPDKSFLLINRDGKLFRIPYFDPNAAHGGDPVPFDIGDLKGCWGEHGFSPDGKWLALSCSLPGDTWPDVFLVPTAGGAPRRLTHQPIAFFRGWSPDGKTIVFASKMPDGDADLYTVAVDGGAVTRLTAAALNDGAEYTPDGGWLYFNSNRSGPMQIWRMRPDGSGAEQVTHDTNDNWYPHIAPDGKQLVYLSYAPGEATIGHPMNKTVQLRLIDLATGEVRTLVDFFGGQGSLDQPSWLDHNHLAFTSYEIVPKDTP
jgi:TolB protein